MRVEEFFDRYYEREVCVIARRDPAYHRDLLSRADLDHVLGTVELHAPTVRMTQLDREIPNADYLRPEREGVVDPVRVAKLYGEGATVVFTHLHKFLPSLGHLCADLTRFFSCRTQANVYATPARAQGFKPHWDTHDVFILQVDGGKTWTFFDTKIELPLETQMFDVKNEAHRAGAATAEIVLEAGDTLYVPRGRMHSARTGAAPSLHITTGIMAFTWVDLFVEALGVAAAQDRELRRSLPPGFAHVDGPEGQLPAALGQQVERLAQHLRSGEGLASLTEKLIAMHRPPFSGLLTQRGAIDQLSTATVMKLARGVVHDVREDGETLVVRAFGQEIVFPGVAAAAVRFALAGSEFRIGELPDDLSEREKLTVARRLLQECLLDVVRCSDPTPPAEGVAQCGTEA